MVTTIAEPSRRLPGVPSERRMSKRSATAILKLKALPTWHRTFQFSSLSDMASSRNQTIAYFVVAIPGTLRSFVDTSALLHASY